MPPMRATQVPLLIVVFSTLLLAAPQWSAQSSGTGTRLRGLSAVSHEVAWASGVEAGRLAAASAAAGRPALKRVA